jgi:hypothetical protein
MFYLNTSPALFANQNTLLTHSQVMTSDLTTFNLLLTTLNLLLLTRTPSEPVCCETSLLLLSTNIPSVLAVVELLPFVAIKNWEKAWLAKRSEILDQNYTATPAGSYEPLQTASTNLQKAIFLACKELRLDAVIIGWPTMDAEIPDSVQEILGIREWLVKNELITEPIEASGQASSHSRAKGTIYQSC